MYTPTMHKLNNPIAVLALLIVNVLALVTIAAAEEVREKSADIGFHLLEEPIGARSVGMGSAGAAASDIGFAYYNPALPAFIRAPYLSAEYGQYSAADLQRGYFETGWPFQNWFFSVGVHTGSVDDVYSVSDEGFVGDAFSYQHTHLALGIGFKRNEVFALGLSINGMQERIRDYYGYAVSIGLGVQYDLIPDKLAFGLSAMNLGTSTRMVDSTTLVPDTNMLWFEGADLPSTGRFGAAYVDTFGTVGIAALVDIVYRHTDSRIMVPVGVEVKPIAPLSVRIGKRFNHDTEVLNFGLGLDVSPLAFNVGFAVPKLIGDAEMKWVVGIRYSLLSNNKTKADTTIVIPEKEAPPIKAVEESVIEESVILEMAPEEEVIVVDTVSESEEADTVDTPVNNESKAPDTEIVKDTEPERTESPSEKASSDSTSNLP